MAVLIWLIFGPEGKKTGKVDAGGAGETSDVLPGIVSSFQQENGKIERPYFDVVGSRNVTSVVGQTATLKCRVKHLGDRTVSWIRKRDLHVLTSSIYTFTGDARFAVIHPENSDDWRLEIRYVQKRDAGVYECQVNTEPKMNLAMLLNVEDREMLAEQGIHSTRPTKGSHFSLSTPARNPGFFLFCHCSGLVMHVGEFISIT
ncbi:unnamed protein product [Allacma fusca]|uniref:Ig-like domain-containing protein n=1 Tax=Allacma fusca TaxID=39272 RepID=A0A8J2PVF4_9HEXA|nr:unnamed protein product [Allacma fusca]